MFNTHIASGREAINSETSVAEDGYAFPEWITMSEDGNRSILVHGQPINTRVVDKIIHEA